MKTYTIQATMTTDLTLDIEAESSSKVWDKIHNGDIDGGDFTEVKNSSAWTWCDVQKTETILEELKAAFPDCWFKNGAEFDGNSNRLVWSGEGSTMPDGLHAFDITSNEWDANENQYTLEVHNDLVKFCHSRGYYWESYDAGTFFLYKATDTTNRFKTQIHALDQKSWLKLLYELEDLNQLSDREQDEINTALAWIAEEFEIDLKEL